MVSPQLHERLVQTAMATFGLSTEHGHDAMAEVVDALLTVEISQVSIDLLLRVVESIDR